MCQQRRVDYKSVDVDLNKRMFLKLLDLEYNSLFLYNML